MKFDPMSIALAAPQPFAPLPTLPLSATITRFEGVARTEWVNVDLSQSGGRHRIAFADTAWTVTVQQSPVPGNPDAVDVRVGFTMLDGEMHEVGVSVDVLLEQWAEENYVLLPGAVYNGNRFTVSEQEYPPMLTDANEIGPDVPTIITDVPRLSLDAGPSALELRTGDLTTPAFCSLLRRQQTGLIVLLEQHTDAGETGIAVREADDRATATLTLSAPAVRATRYAVCTTSAASDDRGVDVRAGDEITVRFRVYRFGCPDESTLIRHFMKVRQDLSGPPQLTHEIPFSSAWEIVEDKYNRENWREDASFYRSSLYAHEIYGEWQTGWIGGAMNTLPMLAIGNEVSKTRSARTLDFLFDTLQAPSGFVYGIYSHGRVYGDDFREPDRIERLLIRKNADLLYFLGKHISLLEEQGSSVPEAWRTGYVALADAFAGLWRTTGQWGQFVDLIQSEIYIGGSACAGIAPAGLALAAAHADRADFLEIAEQAAQSYYENYVRRGYTTGGPGEILQGPDSESAFALLESFVVLHEATGRQKWLRMAEEAAALCATWVVSYDYQFPESSEFHRLDLRSTGAVWANVQNKHAGPGICTLSGDSLFKLYRMTGDSAYLELLRSIAHNLPQYMSREDRPLLMTFPWPGLAYGEPSPAGRMGERVQLSDWEGKENIGGGDGGSTWCEVSLMLTCLEVPGLYVQPDSGLVFPFDHVEARVVEHTDNMLLVSISNPTEFDATVSVMVEDRPDMTKPLGPVASLGWRRIRLAPHEERVYTFARH